MPQSICSRRLDDYMLQLLSPNVSDLFRYHDSFYCLVELAYSLAFLRWILSFNFPFSPYSFCLISLSLIIWLELCIIKMVGRDSLHPNMNMTSRWCLFIVRCNKWCNSSEQSGNVNKIHVSPAGLPSTLNLSSTI